jgi:hypothetical protein
MPLWRQQQHTVLRWDAREDRVPIEQLTGTALAPRWRQPPEHTRGVPNEELMMAANLRAEELESQSERDLAPQLAVASPSCELSADIPHPEEPASLGSPADSPASPTAESHHEAIARAAYHLAQARRFEPGHELDDWLAAEQKIGSH